MWFLVYSRLTFLWASFYMLIQSYSIIRTNFKKKQEEKQYWYTVCWNIHKMIMTKTRGQGKIYADVRRANVIMQLPAKKNFRCALGRPWCSIQVLNIYIFNFYMFLLTRRSIYLWLVWVVCMCVRRCSVRCLREHFCWQ